MQLKLYHYVHCPFCVRVRMALGFLNLPYESIVVDYDNESLPISLTGIKMLPILSTNGKAMNESLDIIKELDKDDLLKLSFLDSSDFISLNKTLDELAADIHNLAMPYWIWTPEFNDKSRSYFETKKSKKRGPFNLLVQNSSQFQESLNLKLLDLENIIEDFYISNQFNIKDILLASHLWGMYIVPEFQFTPKIHSYLQRVKTICNFKYHQDFWK